jgi:DNA polymerase III subunit epsilon
MFLFFDTETSGLPKNWKAPITDLDNWPRLIQIGWIVCDKNRNRIKSEEYIIKPEGFEIPTDASDVHGITTEKALQEGDPLISILEKFNELVNQCEYIIAHNLNFDEKIIRAEFIRNSISTEFIRKKHICTMASSTNFCAIDGPYGYKWPKLEELHIKLFNKNFENAHNAFADIDATEKCFWKLIEIGIIKVIRENTQSIPSKEIQKSQNIDDSIINAISNKF